MVVLKALNLSKLNSLKDHPYSTRTIQAIKKNVSRAILVAITVFDSGSCLFKSL